MCLGTTYRQLVLLGQLVHTENGNDILERLVVLEDLLDGRRDLVVLRTDDTGVKHTRLGVERVDGGVDTKLSDRTRQHGGGVQVREGGGRSGIRQIVSGHVDGLHGGDGTLLGRGDTLLPVGRKKPRQILMSSPPIREKMLRTCHPCLSTAWAGNRRQTGYDRAGQTPPNPPG